MKFLNERTGKLMNNREGKADIQRNNNNNEYTKHQNVDDSLQECFCDVIKAFCVIFLVAMTPQWHHITFSYISNVEM